MFKASETRLPIVFTNALETRAPKNKAKVNSTVTTSVLLDYAEIGSKHQNPAQ
jgi:hypothetical protein